MRALVYYEATKNYDEARRSMRAILDSPDQPSPSLLQLRAFSVIASCYKEEGDFAECIKYNQEGLQAAHALSSVSQEAMFSFEVGTCMLHLKNREGLDYMDKALSLLEHDMGVKGLPMLSYCMGEKMRRLVDFADYAAAIGVGRERLAVIHRIETEYQGVPDGYVDQQYGYAYSVLAYCLVKDGQREEAIRMAEAFDRTHYASTPSGMSDIMMYESAIGDGERLLQLSDSLAPLYLQSDTVTADFASFLLLRAEAFRIMSQYREADGLMQRVNVLNDSLAQRERDRETVRLSELYRTQEKDLQLLSLRIESRQNRLLSLTIALLLVLALGVVVMQYRHAKEVCSKNRFLIRQMGELQDANLRLHRMKRQNPVVSMAMSKDATLVDSDLEGHSASADGDEAADSSSEAGGNAALAALFDRLEEKMEVDHIFLDPNLSREAVMKLLHINRNQLSQMLHENVGGITISAYINNYRARYACYLLRHDKHINVDDLAVKCGFLSARTFNRIFKELTTMSPREYRKNL